MDKLSVYLNDEIARDHLLIIERRAAQRKTHREEKMDLIKRKLARVM